MHIHILGICGTFMGSLAQLAKALGHRVTGSDHCVYPPMSTQLAQAGIELIEGFAPEQLDPAPDLVVVGNVISRGNPAIEAVLNRGLPYTSGPQWLCDHLLQDKWVLAVAGTHGKTTVSSMLAWVLEYAGMQPGFLIGGVPNNFSVSARLGQSDFFVVEADEYDSAFFDKRSKFVHYHPRTLIMNNLEYDHADIFADLAAIQKQFHHLVRTIPSNGLILSPAKDEALEQVLQQGCWSEKQNLGLASKAGDNGQADWLVIANRADGSEFDVLFQGQACGCVRWSQLGRHNMLNGLAAIAAARHVGVEPALAIEALGHFTGVKRRMEQLACAHDVFIYDDFAHHPTAIKTTLAGLRARVGETPIIAVIEPRSSTMREGIHGAALFQACEDVDRVLWYEPPGLTWSMNAALKDSPVPASLFSAVTEIIDEIVQTVEPGTHVVIMSNGGFDNIHQRLADALLSREIS